MSLMHQHGKISKEQMETAQNISITTSLVDEEENKRMPISMTLLSIKSLEKWKL
ncbi:hypothetical protein ACI2OX_10975 [Bacillus sp. N9]